MFVLLIMMALVVASLWQQVRALRDRVDMLEHAGTTAPVAELYVPPEPVRRPLVEPVQAPIRRVPARVVSREAIESPSPPAPPPPPVPAPAVPEAQAPQPRGAGFEDIFGRRLPIWAGGITLAVAGFLIVRYSIQAGLLSPLVRIVMGLLFGGGLIAAAEVALRQDERIGDARVRQALAGAGIATLYATVIAAANLYHLVGPVTAFAGMAAITALAAGLSLRFGAPSALLGLVGGLAAPALVGSSQPDVPLLTLYLTLAVGGLCALGRQQRWWWLGAAALAGGFGWGSLLILGGALDVADALSVGLYTLALAIGLPLLLIGERGRMVRLAGAVMGCAQLAALVAVGGFAPLHWALFGLISIALVWLSRREALFADVPALGLGVAILLGIAWPHPDPLGLGLLLAGIASIYGLPAALRTWRADSRPINAPSVAGVALAIGALPLLSQSPSYAAIAALVAAALCGTVAYRGWHHPARRTDARFAILAITVALSLGIAATQSFALWALAPAAASLGLALLTLGDRAEDNRVIHGGHAFALLTALLLLGGDGVGRLGDWGATGGVTAFLTWAVPAVAAAWNAWHRPHHARLWQPAAVLVGYGAVAQVVAGPWLSIVPVTIVAGLAATRRAAVLPAVVAAILPMAYWSAEPIALWLLTSLVGLTGTLVPARDLPEMSDAARLIALPGAVLLAAAMLLPVTQRIRRAGMAIGAAALLIAVHIGYRHAFGIDTPADTVRLGMAERTGWQMLLAAAALLAWRRRSRPISLTFGAMALLHFAWFTMVVANPLWVVQQVGIWLIPAYVTAGLLVWSAPTVLPQLRRARDWALMVLIVVGSVTLLRQALHAPMVLAAGTGEGEQIARSILAIALAGLFLWIGIARHARDWRIASLALMLVAVVKVFLLDAAGLTGLARIASFAALGFSLIGVGWLYSRYLPDEAR